MIEASDSGTLRLGQSSAVLKGRYPVLSVTFSPDGRLSASADENGYITLWDVAHSIPCAWSSPRRRC